MEPDPPPLGYSPNHPSIRYARRQSDVHAGLAAERLQDLVERLRRLAGALSQRGDDLAAESLDVHVERLGGLRDLLHVMEAYDHQAMREEREDQTPRKPLPTLARAIRQQEVDKRQAAIDRAMLVADHTLVELGQRPPTT